MFSLSWRRALLVGLSILGINVIWPIFNSFVPIFLQAGNPEYNRQLLESGRQLPALAGFGLAPAVAFFVMTWDNLINLFLQPWAGGRSDHTWNRFGRRKPWVLAGAPLAALAFVMVPHAATLPALMALIVLTSVGMALFRAPTAAWLGDLFPPLLRSKASGVVNTMGGLGTTLALVAGGLLFARLGRAAPFAFGALVMLLALAIPLSLIKEPRPAAEASQGKRTSVVGNLREMWRAPEKSLALVLLAVFLWFMAISAAETGVSSFAVFSLGMSPARASLFLALFPAMQIVFAVPIGWIATRTGRRSAILLGLAGCTLAFLYGFLFVNSELRYVALLILTGVCWAFVLVNALPLVYDVGDDQRIGAFTGLYFLAAQLAAVAGPVMAGGLVQVAGHQPRMIFVFGSVFMGLALLTMLQVRAEARTTPLVQGRNIS